MGQKDLTEKNLEFYPDVFADIVNVLLYNGKQEVLTEELQAAPTETLYLAADGNLRNQFHDVSMYVIHNGKIKIQYMLENETQAKRKTVLRKAGYEGAVYREQCDKRGAFPIISCILYWGKGKWKQPQSIHQLWKDSQISGLTRKYITDVRLHVFNMRSLSKDVRKLFKSDMRIVVDYLAEGKDYIPSRQKIIHLEALVRMLKILTNDERYEAVLTEMVTEEKGGITMCELLDKYINCGMEKGVSASICNLMETMQWTVEQAMDALKIPNADREKYAKMI